MAHQQLKFPVNPKDCDVWQPIFGGQHHGTFYMIYIKIHKHEFIESDKLPYVYTCDFKLQNYRGSITMGLDKVQYNTYEQKVEELENEGLILHIKIDVKPFLKNDEILGTKVAMKREISDKQVAVTQINLKNPKLELFNPEDLDSSLYINPHTHFRDGDAYDEVSRRPAGSDEDFPDPSLTYGTPLGFCLADVLIFKF
ncbi:MAG: hypothetical protein ED556_04870 [Winogradskyella sp.]|uniref:hypothetical protein n=1 Tax=Winogradskyella sp. TaxID=1883156 RepID=UPI000F3B6F01|nr:hypothetical protein [Winogradskyella sp.]RNC86756.1 MAG: hypothetical protein ED556_04870 [Winogradskyella sp.]